MLYDEHTWGAHNSVSQPDHPFVQRQWAIKQAFALDGDRQSRELLDAALATRGDLVPPEGNVNVIDVYNTNSGSYPWSLVTVPAELSTAGDAVKASLNSTTSLPAQRLSTGELVCRPCWPGYMQRRLYITEGSAAELRGGGARVEGSTLTCPRSSVAAALTVRIDETSGAIQSLVYDDHEFVDRDSDTAINDYFYLLGSDLNGLQRAGPVKISVKERGPLIASLLIESEAAGCRKLTREVRVHALRNYVEIINTLDKLPVRDKEGVHFGFGFHVPDGTVRMEGPWSVIRPEEDQIPGACRNWFTVQRWVDVSNDKRGITWLTPDAPLIEIGGITANLIGAESDPSRWMDHIQPSQTIYSWAMNNHWFTNYRAEQEGPTTLRYFLVPHGKYHQSQASRVAVECSQPLVVSPARGEEPPGRPAMRLATRNVQVTAFKPSEDGRAWIVRLFGVSGQDTTAKIQWSDPPPRSVWRSDNSERPLAPLGETIDVPAYQIVTVRAEFPE